MSAGQQDPERIESDVETIKQKFGPLAEAYAENRREAAAAAGNESGEQHWKNVARLAEDDDQ
jgi:hydroxymethylpyrimidine/phosphomethylpyrimidine kinase